MITIDKLCYQSKLRYVNAESKFAFAVLTLLICVFSHSIVIAAIVFAATGILTVHMGGIPFFRYMRLIRIPLAFLILSTFAILLHFSHQPQDLFAVPIGSWYLTGSIDGLMYCIQLIATAMASVSCLYFLSLHTPMPDILQVLDTLHCPELLIELMMLIYRFIFILLDASASITTAQNSRLGNRDYKTSLKSFSSMVSVLFLRSFKRANALYDAMESRCYDGRIRVLKESHPPKLSQILGIILFDGFLIILLILKYTGFPLL